MTSRLFTKRIIAILGAAFTLCLVTSSFAQNPGGPGVQNNTTGKPPSTTYNADGKNATVIFANSDGANRQNAFLYFKVYAPGGGSAKDFDWYTNPSAWMNHYEFNLYHLNLNMFNNMIRFNNAPASRRIVFDQDTWSTDDNQFTGLGSTTNNDLRYQVKDATKSHKFFAGFDDKNSKSLLTINGNGAIGLPKAGQLFFGYDVDRQPDAGSIAYQKYSDGLDIFGAGVENASRIVKVWAEKGTSFNGLVSIGSTNWTHTVPPTTLPGGVDLSTYKLFVNGGVLAKEVRVETGWADYVFKPDYKLLPLADVEKQIRECGHLPGMPSAHEVEQNGVNLGQMVKLQQEKIEELTLHLITMKKELEVLTARLNQVSAVSSTK